MHYRPGNPFVLLYLFLGFYFCSLPISAQTIQELKTELSIVKNDSAKFSVLYELSGAYRSTDLDSAILYGQEALALAKKKRDNLLIAKANYQIGAANFLAGQYSKALELGEKALFYGEVSNDLLVKQYANNLMGVILRETQTLEEALPYTYKSLSFARQRGDTRGIITALANIGQYHEVQRDTVNARAVFEEVLTFLSGLDWPHVYSSTLISLSNVTASVEEKKELLEKAREVALSVGDNSVAIVANENLGFLLDSEEEYEDAVSIYGESILIAKELGRSSSVLSLYIKVAYSFIKLNKLDSAAYYLQMAYADSTFSELKRFQSEYYGVAANLAEAKGQFKKALENYQEKVKVDQIIYDEKISETMSDARIRYETAEKENQIIQQGIELESERRKRQMQALGAGVLLLLLGSFSFLFWQRRQLALQRLKVEQSQRAQLEELDRMKSRFFVQVSHELRTPLTLVLGPLEQLLGQERLRGIHPTLQTIRRNARRQLDRVNELLDISRLESGKLDLTNRPIALRGYLMRIGGTFSSVAESNQQRLELEVNVPSDVTVLLDTDKVEKIVNNLLHNAHKFSGMGSAIWFRSHWSADQLQVEVSDSGPGFGNIDPDLLFEQYVRGDKAVGIEGSGIGLSLVRELVLLMGGTIKARNRSEGGALFQLTLPAMRTTARIESEETVVDNHVSADQWPSGYQPLGAVRPRVLIVEDNPELGQFIYDSLQADFDPTLTLNGQEALTVLQKKTIDLIVSDIMMPHMDGFGLRQKLMDNANWSDIPFVFLTARVMEEDRLQALRMGVDDYMLKPFSIQELQVRLQNLMQRRLHRAESPVLEAGERPATEQLLRRAEAVVRQNLDNSTFKIEDLADALGYSRRQLQRLLNKETGLSPVAFLLELRLQEAYRMLHERKYFTVAEVRYEVGIESASYFTSKFQARFGVSPSDILVAADFVKTDMDK
ncbi:MAG: response regulator [Saprospiraceae bacterium]|nr:response regulator [Saprospiraceae bacterium]